MRPFDYSPLYQQEDVHWWCQGMQRITLALLDQVELPDSRPRILDAGCGAGGLAARLQGRSWVAGMELSRLALHFARARRLERLTCGSVDAIPFADAAFDLAIALDVLYHGGIRDNAGALAELRRILRPGGWLLLRVPAYEWMRGPHDLALGTTRRFTARGLQRVVQDAGFTVQRVTYANTILFPCEAIWRLTRRRRSHPLREGQGESDLARMPDWFNTILAGILSAERRALRWIDLPFGLSVYYVGRKPVEHE